MPGGIAQAQVGHWDHLDWAGRGSACWFPSGQDSPRQARRFVLSQLGPLAGRPVAADATIVIAELAANAVVHARSPFTVAVWHLAGAVRISVRDAQPLADGERFVILPGHGLDLVAKVSARWAIEPLPDGKVIWAELPTG